LKPKKTPRRNATLGVAFKKDLKSIDSLLQTATPRRTKLLALEEKFESKTYNTDYVGREGKDPV
jgi:hypothetical protein